MRSTGLVGLAGGVAAVLLLAGCGDDKGADGDSAKGRLFGVTFQTMNNPFFVDLNEGIKNVVQARGDRLVTLGAQWNSLKQRNDISDLIHQGAAAIFINPVNWEGIAAIKAGKLLSTSARFPGEIGRIAAEKTYEHLAGKPVGAKDIKVKVGLITKGNADSFLAGQ